MAYENIYQQEERQASIQNAEKRYNLKIIYCAIKSIVWKSYFVLPHNSNRLYEVNDILKTKKMYMK